MHRGRAVRAVLMGAVVAFSGSMLAPSAQADTIDFSLTTSNLGAGFTGPFANVDVNRTSSTTATITFTSDTNGGFIYLLGDGSSAAVNVNATSFTVGCSPCSSTQLAGFNTPTFTVTNPPGTSNVDGVGLFNAVIDSSDGAASASTKIDFTLTNTSGTWANAGSVLALNNDGFAAAAHIFACTASSCTSGDSVVATGFAAGVPGPVVGAGLPGLVAACGGLLALARRRRQKIA